MTHVTKPVAFLCLFTLVFSLQASDWPNFRGPNYDGIYSEPGLKLDFRKNKPKRVWEVDVKTGFSSISTSKGKVYTMGHSGGKDYVFCINDSTGRVVWKKSYRAELQPNMYEGGPNATPTVHDGLVYTFGKHGQFHCWDANRGTEKWSVNVSEKYGYRAPSWGFTSSPYIKGDLVILNAGSAGIAFNRKSGKLAWKSNGGGAAYASPVPYKSGSKDAFLLFSAKTLKCLEASNGKAIWEVNWETAHDVNGGDPVLSGKDVFISSGYGRGAGLVSVNGRSANIKWSNKVMRNHFSSSVVVKGYAYGIDGNTGDGGAGLKCVRLSDGQEMWSEEMGFGSLTMANDKLLVLTARGQLISVDANPNAYKDNGRVQILGGKCWTSPIVSNGHVYARNAKGDLKKFKLK